MRGAGVLGAATAVVLAACASGTPVAVPVRSAPPASATASPTPSVAASLSAPSPTVDPRTVVVLSDTEVAGVRMGTPAREAERRLTRALGLPSRAEDDPGCNGETGRVLGWGDGLAVYLIAENGAAAALTGWSASPMRRFDYRLPYETRLGETAASVERQVPGARGLAVTEGAYDGSYLVRTDERPGLTWVARGTSSAAVTEVAYNPVGCD